MIRAMGLIIDRYQRCTADRFIFENHPDWPFLEIVTVTAVVLGSLHL
jgi:hypothetical protein